MKKFVQVAAACGAPLFAAEVAADDVQMPKMFKGMQKVQWKAEITESSANKSGKPMPTMVICTDNLMQHQTAQKTDSGCKRRFIKDTASEAVMESVCPERTSTVTMKKENAKNVTVAIEGIGNSIRPPSRKSLPGRRDPVRELAQNFAQCPLRQFRSATHPRRGRSERV